MNAEDTSWIFFSVLINFLFVLGKCTWQPHIMTKKKMEFQLTTVILVFFFYLTSLFYKIALNNNVMLREFKMMFLCEELLSFSSWQESLFQSLLLWRCSVSKSAFTLVTKTAFDGIVILNLQVYKYTVLIVRWDDFIKPNSPMVE